MKLKVSPKRNVKVDSRAITLTSVERIGQLYYEADGRVLIRGYCIHRPCKQEVRVDWTAIFTCYESKDGIIELVSSPLSCKNHRWYFTDLQLPEPTQEMPYVWRLDKTLVRVGLYEECKHPDIIQGVLKLDSLTQLANKLCADEAVGRQLVALRVLQELMVEN